MAHLFGGALGGNRQYDCEGTDFQKSRHYVISSASLDTTLYPDHSFKEQIQHLVAARVLMWSWSKSEGLLYQLKGLIEKCGPLKRIELSNWNSNAQLVLYLKLIILHIVCRRCFFRYLYFSLSQTSKAEGRQSNRAKRSCKDCKEGRVLYKNDTRRNHRWERNDNFGARFRQ